MERRHNLKEENGIRTQYGTRESWAQRSCGDYWMLVLLDPACKAALTLHAPKEAAKTVALVGQHVLFIGQRVSYELCFQKASAVVCVRLAEKFIQNVAPRSAWSQTLIKPWFDIIEGDTRIEAFADIFLTLCGGKEAMLPFYAHAMGVGLAVHILRVPRERVVVVRKGGLAPEQLQRVMAYYEAHFKEKFDFRALARVAGLANQHFIVVFKQTTGKTPREYLGLKRLRHAQQLLREGNISVVEAALAAGFSDQSHYRYWVRLSQKKQRLA